MCEHMERELRQMKAEAEQADAIRTVRTELDREPVRGELGSLASEDLATTRSQRIRPLVGATH